MAICSRSSLGRRYSADSRLLRFAIRRYFLCVLRLCHRPRIACRYELFSSKQKYLSSRDTIRLPWVRVMGVTLPDEVMAAPVVMMFIAANAATCIVSRQIVLGR